MAGNILDSYLVSLDLVPNMASFAKFQGVLKQAEGTVTGVTGGMVADVLKFQFAATGAFLAVGGGVLGYIDKLAMSDQQMRLFAQRSAMTLQQARTIKTSLDILGVSLAEASFDKELNGRFMTLNADGTRATKMLGEQYETNMQHVRDLDFQLKRLEGWGNTFGMKFANDLLTKLGIGDGTWEKSLEQLNSYVEENIPKWSDELTTEFIPALKQTKEIGLATFGVVKEGLVAWQNLIGVMTDDKSLQTQEVSFHSIGRSVQYAAHYVGEFLKALTTLETAGGKSVESVILRFGSLNDAIHGHFKEGQDKLVQSDKLGREAFAIMDKADRASLAGPNWRPEDEDAKRFMKDSANPLLIDQGFASMVGAASDKGSGFNVDSTTAKTNQQIARSIAGMVGNSVGVKAGLIYGMMALETGNFTHMAGMNNFSGIRDPKTKQFRNFASIDDYTSAFAHVLSNRRYLNHGLREATTGAEIAHALKTPNYTYYGTDDEGKYGAGVDFYRRGYDSPDGGGGITVGTITVNIAHPGASAEHIQAAVKDGVRQGFGQQARKNMTRQAGAYPG